MADSDEVPWPTGHIAILYSDIEDSSKVAGELHDSAYDKAVKFPHYHLLLEAVKQNTGRIFQDKGDGVIAIFQHTRDAVNMAVQFQRALAKSGLEKPDGSPLKVRIGIHTARQSLPLADADEHPLFPGRPNYGSEDLNFASRVEFLAAGGQVLLSEDAQKSYKGTTGAEIPLYPWRQLRLKSVDHAEDVYDLLYDNRSPMDPGSRFGVAFHTGEANRYISRKDKEEEVLRHFTEEGFRWRIVAIRGVGGSGKTRLALSCGVQLASQLRQQVFFISLADPALAPENATIELVAAKIGIALGFPDSNCDEAGVLAWAATTEAILILDNAESVASSEVRRFLGKLVRPGKCRLLVTSRTIATPQGQTKDVSLNEGMNSQEAERLLTYR